MLKNEVSLQKLDLCQQKSYSEKGGDQLFTLSTPRKTACKGVSVVNVWTKAYIQLTPEYARGQQSAVEFIHLYFQIPVFDAYISIWNSKGTYFHYPIK